LRFAHTERVVPRQSSDSVRDHGPNAIGRPQRPAPPARRVDPEPFDNASAPSSAAPTALRGNTLSRALAGIDQATKVEPKETPEPTSVPSVPTVEPELEESPQTKRSPKQ
jgi:hypothetical protein